MSQRSDNPNAFDPFSAWRTMRDANLDTWAKMMVQFVNSDAYAQATASMLDSYLTASEPFRRALETTMAQVLTQFNMPTRTDVTTLAERLTNIEMRLDDLDARLDAIERVAQRTSSASTADQPVGATEEQ